MSFLENCFNTMLEYGEAIKSSFAKGHVSDWPEKEEPAEEPVAIAEVEPEVPAADEPEATPEGEE
jgi:hypothetical protein